MESMRVRLKCPDKEQVEDQISEAKKDISDDELLAQKKEKEKFQCAQGIREGTTSYKCIKNGKNIKNFFNLDCVRKESVIAYFIKII